MKQFQVHKRYMSTDNVKRTQLTKYAIASSGNNSMVEKKEPSQEAIVSVQQKIATNSNLLMRQNKSLGNMQDLAGNNR